MEKLEVKIELGKELIPGQIEKFAPVAVVIATGATCENSLIKFLEGKGFDLFSVGDCVRPRDILSATSEGAEIWDSMIG